MKASTIRGIGASRPAGNLSVAAGVLAELFDHAPDLAFFVKDAAGRYLAVNDSLVKRHGHRLKSQILGRRPCDICPGDFGRLPAEQDAQVLRTGKALIDHLEQQWYLPQRPVWCLTTKLPLRDATGKVIGIVGISRDVRSRRSPPARIDGATTPGVGRSNRRPSAGLRIRTKTAAKHCLLSDTPLGLPHSVASLRQLSDSPGTVSDMDWNSCPLSSESAECGLASKGHQLRPQEDENGLNDSFRRRSRGGVEDIALDPARVHELNLKLG